MLRRVVLPLDLVERHVPTKGRILDAACGYGLLSILMALRSADREVIGMDLDARRIDAARGAADGIPRLRFAVGDLRTFVEPDLDAIALVDALHYFEPSVQLGILRNFRRMLVEGGVFVCRNAVRETGPRYWWSWIHEHVTVGFKITATVDQTMCYLTLPQFISQMQAAGFVIEHVERTRPWLPYTDRLFVARASSSPS